MKSLWSVVLGKSLVTAAFCYLMAGCEKHPLDTGDATPPVETHEGTAAVVQVHKPGRKPLQGGHAEIGVDEEAVIEVRNPALWLKSLIERGQLEAPAGVSTAELEAEKKRITDEAGVLYKGDDAKIKQTIDAWVSTGRFEWESKLLAARWPANVEDYLRRMCLFIDGQVFNDLTPDPQLNPEERPRPPEDKKDPKSDSYYALHYHFMRSEANRGKWLELLRGQLLWDRPCAVTIGFAITAKTANPLPMPTLVQPNSTGWQRFLLETAKNSTETACLILIAFLLGLLLVMAVQSNLLRDTGASLRAGGRYPFSLGSCQLAWWTVLIIVGYLFLWVITGDYSSITSSELVLLGISSATGLGAVLINRTLPPCNTATLSVADWKDLPFAIGQAKTTLQNAQQANAQAQQALAATPADANLQTAALTAAVVETAAQLRLDALQSAKQDLEAYNGRFGKIKQFLLDLLSERASMSLHRFQIFAWTLVTGLVFAVTVAYHLKMAAFSETLLTLMGISSGTYLGFKWPEAKREAENPKQG